VIDKKRKIPLLTVPSDDCVIHVGRVVRDGELVHPGTAYHVHQGEWIKITPVTTVGQFVATSKMLVAETSGEGLMDLCMVLSQVLVEWNWTDNDGEPLEQPYRNPRAIMGLSDEEMLWLMMAVRTPAQEPAEERKNGSGPSLSTSSVMADSR
jgi:hypothetical protein